MDDSKFLIVRHQNKVLAALLVAFFLMAYGCNFYGGIKGTVLDNATGKPIEGAVVVAQWTKEHGWGEMTHTLYKITETMSDQNGKFFVKGTIGFLLQPPEMIIYKDGYIPWRNDMSYPGGQDKYLKNNEWNNSRTYRMDKFTGSGNEIIELSYFTTHAFMGLEEGKTPEFDKLVMTLRKAEDGETQKQKMLPVR